MVSRPYAHKSLTELEALFEQSGDNVLQLTRLADELNFRNTAKARALASRVFKALPELSSVEVLAPPPLRASKDEARSQPQPPSASEPSDANAAMTVRPPDITPECTSARTRAHAIGQGPVDWFDPSSPPPLPPAGPRNEASAILATWTVLEALSPQAYKCPEDLASGDRSRVAFFARGTPWEIAAQLSTDEQPYFEVILGAILLDKASAELVKVFGDDEDRPRLDGQKAAIGSIMLDADGCVLAANSIAISSFAWALGPALRQQLKTLGNWPDEQGRIIQDLAQLIVHHDDENKPIPLKLDDVLSAYGWLTSRFSLPEHLIEAPAFALRIHHRAKAGTPPQPSLLNSFYLEDLSQAATWVKAGKAGAGLRRYLGMDPPGPGVNVLEPASAIEPWVAPPLMPQARWPAQGGHPLVLLQQAAVNAARAELGDEPGIISVNGPPGTGKTTLLRDIIAGCIVDRAAAMSGFETPLNAFSTTEQKLSQNSGTYLHFHRLDASLKGHEIVIASSNNKAVENVSRELPLKQANGRHEQMAYFRSISDLLANPELSTNRNRKDDPAATPVQTWGLIAAALGNSRNRAAFRRQFWWSEDGSFRTYLRAARGDNVRIDIKDPRTGEVIDRATPSVVILEKPNSQDAAVTAWQTARARFLSLKKTIDAELASIEALRQDLFAHHRTRQDLQALQQRRTPLAQAVDHARLTRDSRRHALTKAASQRELNQTLLGSHLSCRPGFFTRLFGTAVWRDWCATQQQHAQDLRQATEQQQRAAEQLEQAEAICNKHQNVLDKHDGEIASTRQALSILDATAARARSLLGNRIIDEAFFESRHDIIHLTAPWLPDPLHRQREDLFAAALALHKAFFDAAAPPLLQNLALLMSNMEAGAFKSPEQRQLLGDLWSSLFLVVPAISTTFASIRTMFGDLPAESIGWLLVDEAGQAVPQAAVGAIMRAKRSIVVGDPLQIPPVVSLPEKLNAEICRHFDVDPSEWAAPQASTQTLADRTSALKATFATDSGEREVGMPLLVHRRCQNPMFDISNTIAYAGQMVHAVAPGQPGAIGAALGPSHWIDVNGKAESKWCPQEGDAIIHLLSKLAAAGVTQPDLFVITPFKIIELEMRRRLSEEPELTRKLGIKSHEWGRERIGTIHTFQGREADTVLLLLGAPNANQHGVRQWVARAPNIINVAVSRARQNLYVIGSATAWTRAGTSLQVLQRQLATGA